MGKKQELRECEKMVTIRDVAKKAGVSVASVSRYINKNGYVRSETGEKIAEVIKELNYVPNEVARSLFQKKSKIIGILLPDIANPYFPLLAKGIEKVLNKNGYMMMLANTSDSEELLQEYITAFTKNNVSGIITALPIKPIDNISVVGIDRVYESPFNRVLPDDYLGGQIIANEILKTTFTNILIITGNLAFQSAKKRLDGLIDVLDAETTNYEIFETSSFNVNELDKIAGTIFEKYPTVDTVIAANDYLALRIMQEAQQRGLSIPADLQIMGYDGIPFSNMVYPKLTTIKQPVYEMGEAAATLMVKMLNGEVDSIEEQILPVSLQKGGSLR
ncbi:LacI family DNA-binding transcriptional regulator [Paenilisteria rocourtiae]|nr:LacI family DNA-binding transcriptional regulator [Listeria rocourtiae]